MLLSPHAADPFLTYEEMRERMRPLLGDSGVHLSPFLSRRSLLRGLDMGQSPAGDSPLPACGAVGACHIHSGSPGGQLLSSLGPAGGPLPSKWTLAASDAQRVWMLNAIIL